jgi:signal peptidase I
MSPTISSTSAVVVQKGNYHVGQVVSFKENGVTVTHRLVSIDANGLITTKGDANATTDPWHVPKSQIIGGVVTTVPELGYWLVHPGHPFALAAALLALLVGWQIWSFTKSSALAAENARRRTTRQRMAPVRTVEDRRGPVAPHIPLHVRVGQ